MIGTTLDRAERSYIESHLQSQTGKGNCSNCRWAWRREATEVVGWWALRSRPPRLVFSGPAYHAALGARLRALVIATRRVGGVLGQDLEQSFPQFRVRTLSHPPRQISAGQGRCGALLGQNMETGRRHKDVTGAWAPPEISTQQGVRLWRGSAWVAKRGLLGRPRPDQRPSRLCR